MKIYIVGIEGAGTSSLALIYKRQGHDVSGSDNGDHFYFENLNKENIQIFHDFNENNLPSGVDLVVHSTAFNDQNNSELAEAKKRGLRVLSYPEALAEIFNAKIGIAVSGTYGKTTTTAMLSDMLKNAAVDPSAVVGSNVINWNDSALAGSGEYFVLEADEYQNKLRFYNPWSVILTSVDWDHPDFFENMTIYRNVFKEFVARIPKNGNLIVWGDSSETLKVSKACTANVFTYGFGNDNSYQIKNYLADENQQKFEIYFENESIGIFQTKLTGKHNVLNATAAVAICHCLNLDLKVIENSLAKFEGTARRFQLMGNYNDALIIDDYAHHPEEIKATLAGARQKYPNKNINVVFNPHTFTRTKALLQEFAQSFDDADQVIVIDIYGSARETQGGVHSQDLVKQINRYNFGKAEYIASIDEATEYYTQKLKKDDVLITMGAGDVWKIGEKLLQIK